VFSVLYLKYWRQTIKSAFGLALYVRNQLTYTDPTERMHTPVRIEPGRGQYNVLSEEVNLKLFYFRVTKPGAFNALRQIDSYTFYIMKFS